MLIQTNLIETHCAYVSLAEAKAYAHLICDLTNAIWLKISVVRILQLLGVYRLDYLKMEWQLSSIQTSKLHLSIFALYFGQYNLPIPDF